MGRSVGYDYRKEYESNLSEARVQLGLTIKELCEKVEISPHEYSLLNSGMASPIDRRGKVKESAIALAKFFDMELSDLWSRYFCETSRYAELSVSDVVEKFHPGLLSLEFRDPEYQMITIGDNEEERILWDNLLLRLSSRHAQLITLKFFEEYTGSRIAETIGVSVGYANSEMRYALRKLGSMLVRNAEGSCRSIFDKFRPSVNKSIQRRW